MNILIARFFVAVTLTAIFALQLASPVLAKTNQIIPYDLQVPLAGNPKQRVDIRMLIGPHFIAGSFWAPNECSSQGGFYVTHGLPRSNHTIIKLASSTYPDPLGNKRAIFPSATIEFTIHPHALPWKRVTGSYRDEFGNHGTGTGGGGPTTYHDLPKIPQGVFAGTAVGPFAGPFHIFAPGWQMVEGVAVLGPPQRDELTMLVEATGPNKYLFFPLFDQIAGDCSGLTFTGVTYSRSGNTLNGTFAGTVPNRDPNSNARDGSWTGTFTTTLQP